MCRMSWKTGSLKLLEPSGPHRACCETALPPYKTQCLWVFSCASIMSSHLIRIFNWSNNFTPIPVAARSKQRVYGCSPALMAGSNPAGARISVSCECYVLFTYRPISRPGESYRAGMCHWVWSRTVFTLCTYSTYVEESRLKEIIILLKTLCLWISNSTFPVLSRLTRIEKAVKNTTIIVIYRVLVYIQMSQPTTCFGLFYLGHLQVGYLNMA